MLAYSNYQQMLAATVIIIIIMMNNVLAYLHPILGGELSEGRHQVSSFVSPGLSVI